MKTVWISVVAIVCANTEYHVPCTVIVHYHIIKKQKLNDQQNIAVTVHDSGIIFLQDFYSFHLFQFRFYIADQCG